MGRAAARLVAAHGTRVGGWTTKMGGRERKNSSSIFAAVTMAVALAMLPMAGGQGNPAAGGIPASMISTARAPAPATPATPNVGYRYSAAALQVLDDGAAPTPTPTTPPPPHNCPLREQVNAFSVVTIILGFAGTVASLLVMAVIFGYRKDKNSVRERFILWLTIANLFYSIMCMAPFHMTKEDCLPVMSFTATLVVRSLWFGFKYLIACYEVLIMVASVWMLKKGEPPAWSLVEGVSHMLCWVVATIVILYGVIKSLSFESNCKTSANTHCVGQGEVGFIEQMMQVWLGFFIAAAACWCWLRITLAQIHRQWERAYVVANEAWRRELWSENDRPILEKKQRIMQLQRQAYDETIQPLENYVLVYLLFVGPAVLLATSWCSAHTNLHSTNCEAPCEMVLAARATVSAFIYFQKPESRQQLGDYHRLWAKTYQRLAKGRRGVIMPRMDGINSSDRTSIGSQEGAAAIRTISILSTGTTAASDSRMKHSQKLNWGEDTVAVIDDDMGPGPRDPPQRPAQLPAVVGTLEERLL